MRKAGARSGQKADFVIAGDGLARFLLAGFFTTLALLGIGSARSEAEEATVIVRTRDGLTRAGVATILRESDGGVSVYSADSICSFASLALGGQIVPNTGGGTLNPYLMGSTTVNAFGRVVFYGYVNGSDRNQGIFTADATGISAIAVGCGGGGASGDPGTGCGDPSPIGGTFSGFFYGSPFTPAINDSGDVLFLCDVHGGSSPRGLFLYRSATQSIVKVAAVGDPSPIGGTFGAIGPGSLNNNGKVVFLASRPEGAVVDSDVFLWTDGTVSKVAAAGDPGPDGWTYYALGGEAVGFVDETYMPIGPVPDINDLDQICFRADAVLGLETARGFVVRKAGGDEWYVQTGDATPIGGTYADMPAASLNNEGQIAFFSDFITATQTWSAGWFAGSPGSWRRVLAFGELVDDGDCRGLAWSRNPMQTIDEFGNVLLWTDLSADETRDRLVLGLTDGTLLIVARNGDPSPIGGSIGPMDPWPSITGNIGTLNAATPGAPGDVLAAHMSFTVCDEAVPIAPLATFQAVSVDEGIELRWRVTSDTYVTTTLERATEPIGPWQRVLAPAKEEQDATVVVDRDVEPLLTYHYRLRVIERDGRTSTFGPLAATWGAQRPFALHSVGPNPSTGPIQIGFSVGSPASVRLSIVDVQSREVAVLLDGFRDPGSYETVWDGRTDSGRAAAGIYFVLYQTPRGPLIRKLVVVE